MKRNVLVSILLMVAFAVSRIPGLLPANFSVAYAFAFCAGVYFPRSVKWWLPLVAILGSDVAINTLYYHVAPIGWYLAPNYFAFAILIALGHRLTAAAGFLKLILGSLLGASIFYLLTNTWSWWQDPAYAKSWAGWFQALTVGRPDFRPPTWEFFRNSLLSTAAFTALFVGAARTTAESPADQTAGHTEPVEPDTDVEPREAQS